MKINRWDILGITVALLLILGAVYINQKVIPVIVVKTECAKENLHGGICSDDVKDQADIILEGNAP